MAVGWAGDGAVSEQIAASLEEAAERARRNLPKGESLEFCEECGETIPLQRREALPGVRVCVPCQMEKERLETRGASLYNRRGSKDSQLR
jgi:phage/conjugal plasmid C-4 type zinc finger TraR family protein